MGDAETTDQRFGFEGKFQFANLARTTRAFELFIVGENRHTGAVIATVFQALEAFEQDGGDITFCNCADNSTHAISPD
jgi:hypothetical protein